MIYRISVKYILIHISYRSNWPIRCRNTYHSISHRNIPNRALPCPSARGYIQISNLVFEAGVCLRKCSHLTNSLLHLPHTPKFASHISKQKYAHSHTFNMGVSKCSKRKSTTTKYIQNKSTTKKDTTVKSEFGFFMICHEINTAITDHNQQFRQVW